MDLESIISNHKNEVGIINDIENLIFNLKNQYTNEEIIIILKEIILYNEKKMKEIKSQINSMNNVKKQVKIDIKNPPLKKNNENIETGLKADISNYFNKIENTNEDNEIIAILKKINDNEIINLIKCKILEYITMYKKELLVDNENSNYYLNEINNLNNKLDIILTFQNSIINDNNQTTSNRIISLNKELIYEDIKNLDPSEYKSYQSLLYSIINGTFTGNKPFFISKGKTILEVRNVNGNRIVYDKITDNGYVIIAIFGKNNPFIYNKVINRMSLYKQVKEELKMKIIESDDEQCEMLSNLSYKKRGLHG